MKSSKCDTSFYKEVRQMPNIKVIVLLINK